MYWTFPAPIVDAHYNSHGSSDRFYTFCCSRLWYVLFEVLTAAAMKGTVAWDVMLCSPLKVLFHTAILFGLFFYPEDVGSMFLQNVDWYLCTVYCGIIASTCWRRKGWISMVLPLIISINHCSNYCTAIRPFVWFICFNIVFRNHAVVRNKYVNNKFMVLDYTALNLHYINSNLPYISINLVLLIIMIS